MQALEEVPATRAGWILFADQDVLSDEIAFKIPFAKYEGKDLVLWGSPKLVQEDAYQKLLSVSHKDRQQGAQASFCSAIVSPFQSSGLIEAGPGRRYQSCWSVSRKDRQQGAQALATFSPSPKR